MMTSEGAPHDANERPCERYLWCACVSLHGSRATDTAQRNRQFVCTRQLFEMSQRELFKELRGGAVQQRTADAFTATHDVNESAFVQRLEHAANRHAANLFDFGASDWLTVCNDGKRFERCGRQSLWTNRNLRAFDCFCVLGASEDLPPATLLHEFYSVTVDIVVFAQFVERCRHRCRRRFGIERRQCFGAEWSWRRKESGLKQLR